MTFLQMALLVQCLFLSCFWWTSTTALPTGAVGCEEGRAAVSGLHTSTLSKVLTGPLSQDDIEFQINGFPLQEGVPFQIDIGADNIWRIITAGTFFRGFLVRLGRGDGNVDTRDSLNSTTSTGQLATAACQSSFLVGGVTHNSNGLKNLEEGLLTVDLPSQNMALDVTVVIQNRDGVSIYYYSGFIIHASVPESGLTPSYVPYFPPPTEAPSDSRFSFTDPPFTESLTDSGPTSLSVASVLFLRYPTCTVEAPCTACQGGTHFSIIVLVGSTFLLAGLFIIPY
jgi:hypothetical protein